MKLSTGLLSFLAFFDGYLDERLTRIVGVMLEHRKYRRKR